MVGVGWFNHRASYLMYFGVMAMAGRDRADLADDLPIDNADAEFLVCLGFAPVAGLAIVFLLRYAGVKRRRVDLLLLGQCVLLPVTVVLAGPAHHLHRRCVSGTCCCCRDPGRVGRLPARDLASRRAEFWVMSGILAVLAVLFGAELMLYRADPVAVWRGHAVRLALPVLVLVVSFRLVQVFADALRSARRPAARRCS